MERNEPVPGILHVVFLECDDGGEVSPEAVTDEHKVLGHIVHHRAQAGQAGSHHCTNKILI